VPGVGFPDDLVVVDANYPEGARRVIEAAKELSPKPIKYVIDSRADADHAYENAIFTRTGATTVAYAAAFVRRNEPKFWRQSSRARKDAAARRTRRSSNVSLGASLATERSASARTSSSE